MFELTDKRQICHADSETIQCMKFSDMCNETIYTFTHNQYAKKEQI